MWSAFSSTCIGRLGQSCWSSGMAHCFIMARSNLSAQRAATDIQIARLPGYAPDLNPSEGIWQYLKQVELKNVCCHDLAELKHELRKAIARLRRKPHVIDGCIRQVGCYS